MVSSFGLIFILILLQCVYPGFMLEINYTHSIFLDYDKNYQLSWKFNNKEIIFETIVNTTGYIGFGFSPDGSLANSDIVIGGINGDDSFLTDYHGYANGTLVEDNVQNWSLLSAVEKNSQTKLIFKRNLITDDPYDMNITSNTMRLIWMYSDKEFNRENVTIGGHRSMYLLQIQRPEIPIPDDAVRLIVTTNATVIRNKPTTYWCTHKLLQTFQNKMHVIKIAPIITKGNEYVVHHMLLYLCKQKDMKIKEEKEALCYAANMPETWETCRSLLYAWAIGGTDFPLPAHMGFPIENSNETYMFNLEIHYDNPGRVSGIVDSSGFEISLVPANRDFDAGILEIGYYADIPENRITQKIPPFQQQFKYQGICLSRCLFDIYPPENDGSVIKLIGVFLHSHLLGRKISIYHYRNGKQIGIIAVDGNYDFNYQEMILLSKEIQILPGDDIKVECTYNSQTKSKFTYGGLTTTDEMCLAYLVYYPKIRTTNCLSFINRQYETWQYGSFDTDGLAQFNDQEISKKFEEDVNGLGKNSSFGTVCMSENNITVEIKKSKALLNILQFAMPIVPEGPTTPIVTEGPTTESSGRGISSMKMAGLFAAVLTYSLMLCDDLL